MTELEIGDLIARLNLGAHSYDMSLPLMQSAARALRQQGTEITMLKARVAVLKGELERVKPRNPGVWR